MSGARIRRRRNVDERSVLALLDQVRATDGYPVHMPEGARAFLLPPYELAAWVPDRGGIVGHVALHHDPRSAALAATCALAGLAPEETVTVSRLFVAPPARGAGVARALLDHAVAEAHRLGRRPILDVVKGFDAAIRLYEHAGWQHVGTTTWHIPGGPAIESLLYVAP